MEIRLRPRHISGNARLKAQSLSNSERTTNDTAANNTVLLNQYSAIDDKRSGYQTGLGYDWEINEQNGIYGSVSYEHFGHTSSTFINQVQNITGMKGNILSDIQNSINSDHTFHFHNIDESLDYKSHFTKEGQELYLSTNTSIRNRSILDNIYQYLLPQDSLSYSTRGNNLGTEKETEIRADYSQPIKKNILLGVGSKRSFYDIGSNSEVLKYNGSGSYLKDNY